MYTVRVDRLAEKFIAEQNKKLRRRLFSEIQSLAANPRPAGARPITGRKGLYRVRVGNFRIVYLVKDEELLVLVVRVGHRKEIYELVRRMTSS
ncbi:MAG: type II toxin-antitoxin system RelE/ParE family toxin [Planctomycetota bacterium]